MEGSCSRLLEKSTVYLLVCTIICVHIVVRLCCACIIHLSRTHADVIVYLVINSSMYICVSVAFDLFFSCELY